MDHVIAPLDPDHVAAAGRLSTDLAASLSMDPGCATSGLHITLVSYQDLAPAEAGRVVAHVAGRVAPLTVRAHGYGVFTGDGDSDLSLHVIVVRNAALDRLHARVHAALSDAGATMDGLTRPEVWTPHITLLDRHLDPALLGRAVELLARRPHRSWSVPITSLAISTGRPAHALATPMLLTGEEDTGRC
ncbi:MAG TPA: 2'-5' RNA ligase family protein [Acidimicrobiales bacterium]